MCHFTNNGQDLSAHMSALLEACHSNIQREAKRRLQAKDIDSVPRSRSLKRPFFPVKTVATVAITKSAASP